jgi:hyperosmotically inducible protein
VTAQDALTIGDSRMISPTRHLPTLFQLSDRRACPQRTNRRLMPVVLAPALAVLLLASGGTASAQDGGAGQDRLQEPLTALPDASPEHTGVEAPPGSELWAETRLITTYSLNEHLNPFDIGVDVDGDTVTLSGVVDSPAERDLAVRLARELSGIDNVDDRLQVVPPGEAAPVVNPLYRIVDEANTTARVKLQLLWREPVDGLRVDVTTSGDHLILTGTVRAQETKRLAEQIARRTTGVAEVENRLTVDPDVGIGDEVGAAMTSAAEGLTDAWLTARVAASLRFDRTVDAERIDVSTEDGVVTLSGQVPTPADKAEAAAVAAAIDGVKRVQDVLGVDQPGS